MHAFSQTLVALILVSVAAVYAAGPTAGARAAAGRALLALGVGVAAALAGAPLWGLIFGNAAAGLQSLAGHAGHTFVDDQGAWLLVPAFQLGLFAALWAAAPVAAAGGSPRRGGLTFGGRAAVRGPVTRREERRAARPARRGRRAPPPESCPACPR